MKVLFVMPRAFRFSPKDATSIDLCVRDTVAHSRYRATTTILTEAVEAPFPDLDVRFFAPKRSTPGQRLAAVVETARLTKPDLVVVQQHYPSASAVKALLDVPVLIHHHNIPKRPKNFVKRWLHERRAAPLDANVFVSEAARATFAEVFPRLAHRAEVVHNGLDMSVWKPARTREKTVLVVGRAHPVKGIIEALDAARAWLPKHPDWTAKFILAEPGDQPEYMAAIRSRVADIPRAELLTAQPFSVVKAAYESAAIALVPSRVEPFGRTALEAHAGGAALISSGVDGLAEVSGPDALMLPEVSTSAIQAAVEGLIENEATRRALAKSGRARALARFDIRHTAERFDDLYERLAGRSRIAEAA